MKYWLHHHGTLVLASLTLAACLSSCHRNKPNSVSEGPDMSGSSSPQPARKTDLDGALQYVRNGQFKYVWVFSRRDAKAFDGSDSNYLRTNAPHVVDWVATDDKKKV